jgi:hypothetical protein
MSTSQVIQTILSVSEQYISYSGFVTLIAGFIGNILNIIVFTYLKLFRGNQCVFYLIVGSIVDCGVLLTILIFRISIATFTYDIEVASLFWCKAKQMVSNACIMISLTSVCFVAIDQYLSTSHYFYLRQMSTLKLARRLTCINIFIWILHSIPFGIFFDTIPSVSCTIFNEGFVSYYSFVYLCVLNGILPLIIPSIFSIMAYWNVRHIVRRQVRIVRRRLDRQLTAMVLIRVAFFILVTLPYGIQLVYSLNTSSQGKHPIRVAVEELIMGITSSLFFFNYAVCCVVRFLFYL